MIEPVENEFKVNIVVERRNQCFKPVMPLGWRYFLLLTKDGKMEIDPELINNEEFYISVISSKKFRFLE